MTENPRSESVPVVAIVIGVAIALIAAAVVIAAFVSDDAPPPTPEILREDPRKNAPLREADPHGR
jgi:hypothetical protein